MRPLRVVMQAFGPYAGEQVVDFRELGENRFFLIHGPTGSGKTTVLDAMCFALYGVTTGAERSAEQMRSQFAADTVATEVTFDFALGEQRYRIHRRPAQERAKARGKGTTSAAPEATLWRRTADLDDGADGDPIAVKTTEVNAEVKRLLGFDADQFRQVVMLPQGRFRELLSSDSGKREKIMEALFGTRRYADIEDALKRRKDEVKSGLATAETLRAETLKRAGAESDEHLADLAACSAADRDAAAQARDGAQTAARAALEAAETARVAAGRLAAVESGERALERADEALAEAAGEAEQAAAELDAQAARSPELLAAQERVRALEAVESAAGALGTARGAAESAGRAKQSSTTALAEARAAAEAMQARITEARAAAEDGPLAAAGLAKARTELEAAEAAVETAAMIESLGERITTARSARDEATASAEAAARRAIEAGERRDAVLRKWREGRAAILAAALEPGEPCPVCGSTDHPAPARAETAPPSDADVESAEEALRAALAESAEASRSLGTAETAIAALAAEERELRRAAKGTAGTDAAAALAAGRAACEAAEARARGASEAAAAVTAFEQEAALLADAVEQARAGLDAAASTALLAERDLADAEKAVPQEMREPGALELALREARGVVASIAGALELARTRSESAASAAAAARATRAERAAALESARREASGAVAADLAVLEATAAEAAEARDAAVEEAARLAAACETYTKARSRLDELDAQTGELGSRFKTVAAIADAATGANPSRLSFQRYVLGVFLTDVLEAATRRLEIMTRGRYRLHMAAGPRDRRSAAGLELEVFDEYTGEDRPVSTLSGGEGFLASLALALGLAEVVESLAGGMHLDTVFIDEGFGTLDDEALETAIDALMQLQGRGRLVGIISHVTELQNVVPARLEITASTRGSTARFVVP